MTTQVDCPNNCKTAEESASCQMECTFDNGRYKIEVDYEYEVRRDDMSIYNVKHAYFNIPVEVSPSSRKIMKADAWVDYEESREDCDPYSDNGVSHSDLVKL